MSRRFAIKCLADGRACLNLGSSARSAPGWNNVDFSWLIRLGKYRRLCEALHRAGWLSEPRYERIKQLDSDTIVWDLRNGIPFDDASFDVVYHSHLLEHLDPVVGQALLKECRRVLKPGGILRVVVPDLEWLAREYVRTVDAYPNASSVEDIDAAAAAIFDQLVVRIPPVRAEQKMIVRLIEDVLIGDTARNGTLHRWMYDRFSLTRALAAAAFTDLEQHTFDTSSVAGWSDFILDAEANGLPYKPESLYMEGRRPITAPITQPARSYV